MEYKKLTEGFEQWLKVLGYASSTVKSLPRQAREYLKWLAEKEGENLGAINQESAAAFMTYFANRANRRRDGGISISHINKQASTINLLSKYLYKTGRSSSIIELPQIKSKQRIERTILSEQEIKSLYRASDLSPIGMRDRVMLGLYYGCGLRKREGLEARTSDVLFERELLHVRAPKNGHERQVPIPPKVLADLEQYIYSARPLLLGNEPSEHLLISSRGHAISGAAIVMSLQRLTKKAGLKKKISLHGLRHSIATHLLNAGMDLEQISLFLGHRNLDSTQIYTRIIYEKGKSNKGVL